MLLQEQMRRVVIGLLAIVLGRRKLDIQEDAGTLALLDVLRIDRHLMGDDRGLIQ
jgi:hypothetical protein